ncbi:MAG TPA: DUF1801 domain-containing protein [Kofleriaceae bacterium]|nr:DUF1801 domain-containing protein [Kofleriaceae bacterium]
MGAKPKTTKRTPAKRTPARKAAAATAKPVRKPSGARAGATVDAYVAGLSGWQKDAASRLREIIRAAAPDATESIKWGQPVYEDNGPVCYFKANSEHITFGFWRGTELDDLEWRLEGEGERMKHLSLRSADEVTEESLGGFVRQAVDLNRRLGNPNVRGESPSERAVMPASQPELESDQEPDLAALVVPVDPALSDDSNGIRDESSY